MAPDFQILGAWLKTNPKDQGVLLCPVALPLVYQRAYKNVLMVAFLNSLMSITSVIAEF